jgi:hypothetical protein
LCLSEAQNGRDRGSARCQLQKLSRLVGEVSRRSLPGVQNIRELLDDIEQELVAGRLKNDWATWNETMLPELPRPAPYANPGNSLADHYGVANPAPTAPASAAQQ